MKTGTLWWFYNGVFAIFGGFQALWIALQVADNANKSWWVVFFPSYVAICYIPIASFGFSTQHKKLKSAFTYRKLVRYGAIGIYIYTIVMSIIWLDAASPNWTTFWILQTAVMAGGAVGLFIMVVYDTIKQRDETGHFHRKKNQSRAFRRRRWWAITIISYSLLVLQSMLIAIGVSQGSTGSVWGAYAIPTIILFALGFAFFAVFKTFFQRAHITRIWISQRQVVRMAMLALLFIAFVFILVKQAGTTAFTWETVWIVTAVMALLYAMVFSIMYFICECRIMVQGDGPEIKHESIPNHNAPIEFLTSAGMDN